MNALAGGGNLHGWPDRRTTALWACAVLAVFGSAAARGGQFETEDGAVVITDQFVGPPAESAVVAGPDQVQEAEPCYAMSGPPPICAPRACGPRWDVAVDALMLWEGNTQSLPLLIDDSDATVLNAGNMATQMASGPRVSLIRVINECKSIEGNYFQARPFNAALGVPASGVPYSLTNTGDLAFSDIESATATSGGWIQSAELNVRTRHCGSPISWIAGFRWVQLNNWLDLEYDFANPDPFGSGSVRAASGNDLYGGQIGADAVLWNSGGCWCINGVGKAGLFYNNAYQESTAGFVTEGGDPSPLGTVSASTDHVAFFGEVGLNSTYWIKRWLAWRLGYSVFWAGGVAVAAQQLPLNSFGDGTTSVNATGGVLLHGVTTGFEARW